MGYLDENGLLYFVTRIKTIFATKTDLNTTNSTLSTLQSTVNSLVSVGAQANVIESVKVNGTALSVTDKSVNVEVPTNNNQLTNGAGYQNANQVSAAIQSAISGITQFDFEIVSSLPTTGKKGTIYLVSNGDGYDEYIYVNSSWEKIGTTAVDLSGYLQTADTISNSEIDDILAS